MNSVCSMCGDPFSAKQRRARYCSGACRARASRLRNLDAARARGRAWTRTNYAPRSAVWFITCEFCGDLACVRRPHGKRCRKNECRRALRAQATAERRARQGRENYGYTEATAAAYHRRRALKKGATVEDFKPGEIFERDDWTCGICSEPVDRDLKWPNPLSVSLDHVIPLALGGAHSRDNTQCAHLSCNVRKGAQAA